MEGVIVTDVLALRGVLEEGLPQRWWREVEGCRGSPATCPPPSLPPVARSAALRALWLGSSASCAPHQRTPEGCKGGKKGRSLPQQCTCSMHANTFILMHASIHATTTHMHTHTHTHTHTRAHTHTHTHTHTRTHNNNIHTHTHTLSLSLSKPTEVLGVHSWQD